MTIHPNDLIECTGDPATEVAEFSTPDDTCWRVNWCYQGERMAVGLIVSNAYSDATKYGGVTSLLVLRRMIEASNRHDHEAVEALCK